MTRLQWAGVVGALGLGVLSQIPTHDHETLAGHEHEGAMASISVDSGPATVTLSVTGMTWAGCAAAARVVLRRIEGVENADVSYEAGRAVITYDPTTTSPEVFIPELKRMTGYGAEVIGGDGAVLPAGEKVDPEELGDHDMQEHDAGAHEHEGEASR